MVTNIAPDHLDYHGGYEGYIAAKKHILTHLTADDTAVLNATNEVTRSWSAPRVVWFGAEHDSEHVYLNGSSIYARTREFEGLVIDTRDLPLPGPHNQQNAMAATAAALSHGITVDAIRSGLRGFRGLAHRLEFVREYNGIKFYNDSKATNPHAAMAGLRAFGQERLVAIAGGSAKDADFTEWANLASAQCHHIVLCGATAETLAHALNGRVAITYADTLAKAVESAISAADAQGVVALSPACASFDQFKNFEHRGDVFRQLVQSLSDAT